MKPFNYFLPLFLLSVPALAQEKVLAPATGLSFMEMTILVFILAALGLLGVALFLLKTFKIVSKELLNPAVLPVIVSVEKLEWDEWAALQKSKPSILTKLLGLKPIEEEKDMMLDHEFDGITELNNPVPGWFNVLFYGSIIFGVMYFVTYHVTGWGKLQDEEYAIEMKQATVDKAAYLARSGNKIDENSVKESKEGNVITAGQAVYNANCVACHGDKGQGVVGPNLTDEYSLHGGNINSLFKTIKYGVPEKGMISWEKTLNPKQISEVSNYILSLAGTKPANPKAPQGDKEG